jgi:sulfoacetaldehyde dehydrogenase
MDEVNALVEQARAAQALADGYDQARADELVAAAGWAIMEPARNRRWPSWRWPTPASATSSRQVAQEPPQDARAAARPAGAKSVGVIAEDPARGLVEIARPVGVVCAVTPSTNPAATPANKIINALKGRNAVIVAPSPKGWSTAMLLVAHPRAVRPHRRAARPGAGAAGAR